MSEKIKLNYNEVNVFSVIVYCGMFNKEKYRIRVFESLEKAKEFIEKTFLEQGQKIALYESTLKAKGSLYVSNFINSAEKFYSIKFKDKNKENYTQKLNVREIFIHKERMLKLADNKSFIELKSFFYDEIKHLENEKE